MTDVAIRVFIRWMIGRDMPETLDIEELVEPRPWLEDDFRRQLRQRNCIGMVAEFGDRVVGFMLYELHADRLDVVKFAVHPAWRRRGVARQMVERLKGKLSSHRRTAITVTVPEEHTGGHLFLRGQGFKAERVLRGNDGDGYEFAYRLRAA